jgi:hypothetical protein
MRARARNAHAIAQVWASQARLRCCQGWTAWPFWHARCSAVLPNELTRVASAPRLSRYAATCTWPLCAEYLPQYGGPGPSALIATAWGRCATAAVSGTWWAAVTSCQQCRRLRRRPGPGPKRGCVGAGCLVSVAGCRQPCAIGRAAIRSVSVNADSTASARALQRRRPLRRRRLHVRAGLDQPLHRLHMPRLHSGTIEPQSRSGPTDWLTD